MPSFPKLILSRVLCPRNLFRFSHKPRRETIRILSIMIAESQQDEV